MSSSLVICAARMLRSHISNHYNPLFVKRVCAVINDNCNSSSREDNKLALTYIEWSLNNTPSYDDHLDWCRYSLECQIKGLC